MYLTFGDVKNDLSRVAAGGICPTDDRLKDRLNEAIQRLLPIANWVGTVALYDFCVNQWIVSLPSRFETMIGYRDCSGPGQIHPMSYTFRDNGPAALGFLNSAGIVNCSQFQGSDLGFSPVFYDLCDAPQKLAIYHDVTEAAGTTIIVQGLDENHNVIRSFVDGAWINGVSFPLDAASPYLPVNLFTKITGFIKPLTNGAVRIYYVDPTTADQKLSAILEPDDTSPQFRRYRIPSSGSCCGTTPNPLHRISALVKYAYRPIVADSDRLLIQSKGALKLMLQAIEFEEVQLFDKSKICEDKAISILNDEMHGYMGSGMMHSVRVQLRGNAPGLIRTPR